MKRMGDIFGRVNVQVTIVCALMMIITGVLTVLLSIKFAAYTTADAYRHTSDVVSGVVLSSFSEDTLKKLNTSSDMNTTDYTAMNEYFRAFRERNGIDDLILVKKNEAGENIYVVDAHAPGEPVKITGDAVSDELSEKIDHLYDSYYHNVENYFIDTENGYKFYALYPVSRDIRNVTGILCVEIDAEQCRKAVIFVIVLTILLLLALITIASIICYRMFKKISNPLYQDITNTDALTSLKNKNSFTTDMHNIEGMNNKEKYGVMVIDLNGLKHINDTRGHNIGDKFIQDSSAVIRKTMFNKKQVAYRTGGDEFAIILKDMTQEEIDELMRRFEENITKSNTDNYIKLSMSIGYAVYDKEQDRNFYDTYQRADNMMYEVKREFYRQKAQKEAQLAAENAGSI